MIKATGLQSALLIRGQQLKGVFLQPPFFTAVQIVHAYIGIKTQRI